MSFDYRNRAYDVFISLELSGKQLKGSFKFTKYFKDSKEFSLVFPFSDSQTAYTHKSCPLKVEGVLSFDGKNLPLENAVATLDYTHSYEKRITTWKWSSLGGRVNNNTILINLTSKERFLDRENIIFIDDKIYFIGDVIFEDSKEDPTTQMVYNKKGNVKLIFKPLNSQNVNLYYVFVHSKFSQGLGTYHGTIELEGKEYIIEDILGVKENHYAKW